MMAEESLVWFFFSPTTLTGFGSYLKGKSSIKSASLSLWHNMLACFKALHNGPLEEVKVAEMHQLWLKEKKLLHLFAKVVLEVEHIEKVV